MSLYLHQLILIIIIISLLYCSWLRENIRPHKHKEERFILGHSFHPRSKEKSERNAAFHCCYKWPTLVTRPPSKWGGGYGRKCRYEESKFLSPVRSRHSNRNIVNNDIVIVSSVTFELCGQASILESHIYSISFAQNMLLYFD